MIKISYSLFISGVNFSPSNAETQYNIKFTDKAEKGDPAPGGRSRGYGYGIVKFYISSQFTIINFVETVRPILEILNRMDTVDMELAVDVYHDGQCNYEYSSDDLRALSSLGISCTFCIYHDETIFHS